MPLRGLSLRLVGIIAQWVAGLELGENHMRRLLRAFRDVFPEASL